MAMTRKDYQGAAALIARLYEEEAIDLVAQVGIVETQERVKGAIGKWSKKGILVENQFVAFFRTQSNFNETRFRDACRKSILERLGAKEYLVPR